MVTNTISAIFHSTGIEITLIYSEKFNICDGKLLQLSPGMHASFALPVCLATLASLLTVRPYPTVFLYC